MRSKNPAASQDDLLYVRRLTDHGKDDIALCCHVPRGVEPGGSLAAEIVRLLFCLVMHRHVIALLQDMQAHGLPHDTGTNPADFLHCLLLSHFHDSSDPEKHGPHLSEFC